MIGLYDYNISMMWCFETRIKTFVTYQTWYWLTHQTTYYFKVNTTALSMCRYWYLFSMEKQNVCFEVCLKIRNLPLLLLLNTYLTITDIALVSWIQTLQWKVRIRNITWSGFLKIHRNLCYHTVSSNVSLLTNHRNINIMRTLICRRYTNDFIPQNYITVTHINREYLI